MTTTEIVVSTIFIELGIVILAIFGWMYYWRKVKGYSADMKKRDKNGKVVK